MLVPQEMEAGMGAHRKEIWGEQGGEGKEWWRQRSRGVGCDAGRTEASSEFCHRQGKGAGLHPRYAPCLSAACML